MKKTVIIIPAYNEEKTILKVLDSLNEIGFNDILVVNDGSSDSTKQLVFETTSKLISFETNIGYSKAIQKGLEWACKNNFHYAITYDADGEFFAPDVLRIDKILRENNVKVAVGIRENLPRFSEKVINFLSNYMFGIKDYFCGLKGFNVEYLKTEIAKNNCSKNNTQLLSYAIKKNLLIGQIPISLNKALCRKSRFGMNIMSEIRIFNSFIRGFI